MAAWLDLLALRIESLLARLELSRAEAVRVDALTEALLRVEPR